MNRREFLKGLMLIPAGWKTLFRKEAKEKKWIEQVEEIDDCVEYAGADWAVSPNDLVGLGGDLAKMINTGWEDDGGANVFPQCKVEWEVNYGHCLQESEPYIPGQWSYHNDLCQWLSEIIERDAPGMLLEGQADIEIGNRHVYIRYPCGPYFWCPDIEEDKTQWYERVEKRTYDNDGLVAIYEWELIT